jgi:hypothetical protein
LYSKMKQSRIIATESFGNVAGRQEGIVRS